MAPGRKKSGPYLSRAPKRKRGARFLKSNPSFWKRKKKSLEQPGGSGVEDSENVNTVLLHSGSSENTSDNLDNENNLDESSVEVLNGDLRENKIAPDFVNKNACGIINLQEKNDFLDLHINNDLLQTVNLLDAKKTRSLRKKKVPYQFVDSVINKRRKTAGEKYVEDPAVKNLTKPEIATGGKDDKTMPGLRIVNFEHVINHIKQLNHKNHKNCTFLDVDFIEEKNVGLFSLYKFKCKLCHIVSLISSVPGGWMKSVNKAVIDSAVAAGINMQTLNKFLSGLNMPRICKKTFVEEEQKLISSVEKKNEDLRFEDSDEESDSDDIFFEPDIIIATSADDDNISTLICEKCGSMFDTSHNLNEYQEHLDGCFPGSHSNKTVPSNIPCDKTSLLEAALKYKVGTIKAIAQKYQNDQSRRHIVPDKPETKPVMCQHCGKLYNKSRQLTQHLMHVHGKGQHSCSTCGKIFNAKMKLKRHEIVHTSLKPFQCRFCEKSFNKVWNFRQHERLHTGEKPYQCDLCTKTFRHNVSMKTHRQKHFKGLNIETNKEVEYISSS